MSASLLGVVQAASVVALGIGSTFFAGQASRRSKSTANGWTEGLGKRLDSQDAVLSRVEAKLDGHIRDHVRGFRYPLPEDKD
jgi:hypothetical protein